MRPERYCRWLLLVVLVLAVGCGPRPTDDPDIAARLPDRVDYNWHIKPLLSDRCFSCHGPDENTRRAGLRLDDEHVARKAVLASGNRAIVAGRLTKSAIYHRIRSDNPERMMPPPESNLALSEYEKALILKWIKQGARYEPHWAFEPPRVRASVPGLKRDRSGRERWGANEIDAFVLARLQRDGLQPSPEADRERLLRRVSFDLTGLPPTVEEMEAFLADEADDAFERVVDRLLASDAYGERMATEWLDVARYADSHGYHADGIRTMWPWRDWVIRAFNQDMPFDRFLTWQLAGDLLPGATREQILATGFNRNHPMTAEGGVVDEEYRLEYVFDRTNTTGAVFLGLTMECARCHDHKYDPITQKDYFQLAAFFNNVDELGMTADDRNAGPVLPLPEPEVEAQIAAIDSAIASQERTLSDRRLAVARALEGGAEDAGEVRLPLAAPREPAGLVAHYPLDRLDGERTPNLKNASSPAHVSGEGQVVDGARDGAIRLDDDFEMITLEGMGLYELHDAFSIALWVNPDQREHYQEIFGNTGQKNSYWRGYEMYLDSLDRVSARLIHALPQNVIHVTTTDTVTTGSWNHVALTYDGSSRAEGLRLYVNGTGSEVTVHHDNLYKTILPVNHAYERVDRWLRVGKSYRAFAGDDGILRGAFDDIRVFDRALLAPEVASLLGDDPLAAAFTTPREARSAQQNEVLVDYLLESDPEVRRIRETRKALLDERMKIVEDVLEVMVMQEMPASRPTYVLERGLYDAPGERVQPATPEALGWDENLPSNRLGLAQWLVSDQNPLTARVTVNRYWQMFFGRGLVATPEDFGSQGDLPSHPELLDWLSVEFRESGWDVKALHRLIVTSATYRQDSRATPALRERDPANALLGRGPQRRLSAEMVRDNALAASGLLVRQVGGESVRPYQPPGLWREKGEFSVALYEYEPDAGEKLHRRSMYTFIRRTSPPPMMAAFDAPDRTFCSVRRQRTSTPMQALVLMNDPQFVEASRVLAERVLRESGKAQVDEPVPDAAIRTAFRLLTSRKPRESEVQTLGNLYERERQRYRSARQEATALLSVGEHPRDAALDPADVAAMTMVANTILNFDETYTLR